MVSRHLAAACRSDHTVLLRRHAAASEMPRRMPVEATDGSERRSHKNRPQNARQTAGTLRDANRGALLVRRCQHGEQAEERRARESEPMDNKASTPSKASHGRPSACSSYPPGRHDVSLNEGNRSQAPPLPAAGSAQ